MLAISMAMDIHTTIMVWMHQVVTSKYQTLLFIMGSAI